MAETLELASTGRARCKVCKATILKDTWRMRVSEQSPNFDGDMVFLHHALCAAMRRPTPFGRALAAANELPKPWSEQLKAISEISAKKKIKQVIWTHASEPRCLYEVGGDKFVLVTRVRDKPLTVEGSLDEAIASVPDDDLESVVDTATAAGKTFGRTASESAKPPTAKAAAKKPTKTKKTKKTTKTTRTTKTTKKAKKAKKAKKR